MQTVPTHIKVNDIKLKIEQVSTIFSNLDIFIGYSLIVFPKNFVYFFIDCETSFNWSRLMAASRRKPNQHWHSYVNKNLEVETVHHRIPSEDFGTRGWRCTTAFHNIEKSWNYHI